VVRRVGGARRRRRRVGDLFMATNSSG